MSISQKEDQLFARWKTEKRYKGFAKDGVVDQDAWEKAKVKTLFVLKEINYPDLDGFWDLREFVRGGGRPQTWNVVKLWITGIQNLDRDMTWNEVKGLNDSNVNEYLKGIAILNLKKKPGGGSSDWHDISQHAKQDANHILEQLDLYIDLDLIICCGTYEIFVEQILSKRGYTWNDVHKTSRGLEYVLNENAGIPVIKYFHPQVRYPQVFTYYGLVDGVREIMKKRSRGS